MTEPDRAPAPPAPARADALAQATAALLEIARAKPPCGDESQSVFVNRLWFAAHRDLQRMARQTLKELGHDL